LTVKLKGRSSFEISWHRQEDNIRIDLENLAAWPGFRTSDVSVNIQIPMKNSSKSLSELQVSHSDYLQTFDTLYLQAH
jgi:hypothetical protein